MGTARFFPVCLLLLEATPTMCDPNRPSRVDFSYAFAVPHRLTVGRPDSSDRTLLDLQPGSLRMAWTYDNLTTYPFAAFKTPPTQWDVRLTPEVDGRPPAESRWTRLGGCLPALDNTYQCPEGTVRLRVFGAETAATVRVTIENRDAKPHRFVLRCDSGSWGENPAWVDPARWAGDNLVAGWNERADRVLVLGIGADRYSLRDDHAPPGPRNMVLVWDVPAGESREGRLVRPYRAYRAELDALRRHDWGHEEQEAEREWKALLSRAARLTVPDPGIVNAYLACVADIFIMREPVAGGRIAAVPGTEVYRAPNPGEPLIGAVALDQLGLHEESVRASTPCLDTQGTDGCWADPEGWGHSVWCASGFKAWTATEHYRLTGDREFLARVFPRMLAASRFQERERARTRVMTGAERPLTYGLMPRGFGDCGLMNDHDLYGVFLPHNLWSVYADRLAWEAARELGKTEEAKELGSIYDAGRRDLLAAIRRGAIEEDGHRWIPGVPGKTTGSRWGALNALFPCGLLAPDDPLIEGTLRKVESRVSPGGIPMHTGWLADGMWVAITLDNVAEAHLVRGEGDVAARYLYATLNHATPLLTWCEERGPEPGSSHCTGDRQHLWTPVAVVRCLRDSMVMEEGDGLHLARGIDREWLRDGPVGIDGAASHFGTVSFDLHFDEPAGRVRGSVSLRKRAPAAWIAVHLRLPGGLRVASVEAGGPTELLPDRAGFRWLKPEGRLRFTAIVGAD